MKFKTINPATEETIQEYTYQTQAEIVECIDSTHDAWNDWKRTSYDHRSGLFAMLSNLLESKKEDLGTLISTEMGKPHKQAIAEVEKCAWVCQYYADHAADFLKNQPIETEATNSYVSFEPIGIIFAVMPWNFPFWQVFRFAAPTMMAGNCGILKHSPNTTGCALEIQKLFVEAGFPKNAFTTILADIPEIEDILANPKIAAATLTGSTNAGKSLASLAGKHLKKTVLELGGSDPYIILDDADLDLAAEKCISGRLLNSGQSCIAAKRFIVTSKNKSAFTEKIKTLLQTKQVSPPFDKTSDAGPMARKDLRDKLHEQLEASIRAGAKVAYQSNIPNPPGYYFPITLLTNVNQGMPAYSEELFGPVAIVIEATDEHDAVRIANDSPFGLGAAVFSKDIAKAQRIAQNEIEAGCCFINDFVKSDPRLPFGGIKQSGYGRELSTFGIKEFVNIKTIYQL